MSVRVYVKPVAIAFGRFLWVSLQSPGRSAKIRRVVPKVSENQLVSGPSPGLEYLRLHNVVSDTLQLGGAQTIVAK